MMQTCSFATLLLIVLVGSPIALGLPWGSAGEDDDEPETTTPKPKVTSDGNEAWDLRALIQQLDHPDNMTEVVLYFQSHTFYGSHKFLQMVYAIKALKPTAEISSLNDCLHHSSLLSRLIRALDLPYHFTHPGNDIWLQGRLAKSYEERVRKDCWNVIERLASTEANFELTTPMLEAIHLFHDTPMFLIDRYRI